MRRTAFAWPLLLSALVLGGCSATASSPTAVADTSDLTQSRVTKLRSAPHEALRARYVDAVTRGGDGFAGYAAPFRWGTAHAIDGGLSGEQLAFLADRLLHEVRDGADAVPSGVELGAAELSDAEVRDAPAELLRLEAEDADAVGAALVSAREAGLRVARYAPVAPVPDARPTAGALLVVDTKGREALVLYGRRGPAPLRADCTVTKMISYEFEEALSKEEYPHVEAAEIPLTGDVALEIGVNRGLSNAAAAAEGEDYRVTSVRDGATWTVEAKSPSYGVLGKLVVDAARAVVSGDRDGNGRSNQAAELSCEGFEAPPAASP